VNDSAQKKINEFLQKLPKSEIIDILNSIDNKISSLHNTSSKDFLLFNNLLKENYSKIKEITEANNRIGTFFRKDLVSFIDSSKNSNSLQSKYLNNNNQNITFIINKLSLLYSSFDLIVVPFNNYKQNLITLKYILANINLHLTYDMLNKDEQKSNVERINNAILNVAKNNDQASQKSKVLVRKLLSLKKNACILISKNNTEVSENIKKLEVELNKLDKEEYWPDKIIHRMKKHTQNCFANMDEIVTNIQYHDIIRQKMEHIQTSQKELVSDLSGLNNNSNEIEDQLKVVVSIPEITEIQVAQLLYTNKDYQISIEKITNRLIEVGRELKDLNSYYINLSARSEDFHNLFLKDLQTTQRSFSEYDSNLKNNWDQTSVGINEIVEQYTNLKSIFNKTFSEEKTISTEIRAFEKLIKANNKNLSSELITRLIGLISNLKLNSNSLKNSLNNITTQINSLNSLSNSISNEKGQIEIPDTLIKDMSNEVKNITDTSISYSKTSLTIANDITEALNGIEYYKYFENTVEEIVTKLNVINKKINYRKLKQDINEDSNVFKRIEKLYTMKSERDIHNKLIKSNLSANEILFTDEDSENIADGDIELF